MTTARRMTLRRIGGVAARLGATMSAVMLLLTAVGIALSSPTASAAATNAGAAQVITPVDGSTSGGQPLASGTSITPFSLGLPTGAACKGDSANDGYRVQSFMVPTDVDLATLTFGTAGPLPPGFADEPFRQPLFDPNSTAYVEAQTAARVNAGDPGPIINIPAFSHAVWSPGDVQPGTYAIGIACTLGAASDTQLDRFWSAQITVVEAPSDPAGITWTASPTQTTTTTTPGATTTSTAPGSSTTSTTGLGGTTTTTSSGSTTSSTTTSTIAGTGTTGGSPSGTSGVGGLPLTGSSTTSLVVWSVLLLAFGRMAVLLGRPPRVKAARAR